MTSPFFVNHIFSFFFFFLFLFLLLLLFFFFFYVFQLQLNLRLFLVLLLDILCVHHCPLSTGSRCMRAWPDWRQTKKK